MTQHCIQCPAGEPIGEPAGVLCRIEERPLRRRDEQHSISVFCEDRYKLCPSFRTFEETRLKQSEAARRKRLMAELEV